MQQQTDGHGDRAMGSTSSDGGRPRVLVVEPEALLRWSIVTYLSRWCDVLQVDSHTGADRMLEGHPVDAVVVADGLADGSSDAVEACALARNPSTRVVRTGVGPTDENAGRSAFIEKPFELSKLAEALGINPANVA